MKNKPYRETRVAIFVAPEVGEKFKKRAEEETKEGETKKGVSYTEMLEILLATN